MAHVHTHMLTVNGVVERTGSKEICSEAAEFGRFPRGAVVEVAPISEEWQCDDGDGFPDGLTPEEVRQRYGGDVIDEQTLGLGHLSD